MRVVPFDFGHFYAIDPQPAQAHIPKMVKSEQVAMLAATGCSYTALAGDMPVFVYGVAQVYPHRAALWAYFDKDSGKHMRGIHRVAQEFVASLDYQRLEFEVACDFEQGHRWARMLGFTCDVERLRCYDIRGGDVAIYSKVK